MRDGKEEFVTQCSEAQDLIDYSAKLFCQFCSEKKKFEEKFKHDSKNFKPYSWIENMLNYWNIKSARKY